MWITVTSNAAYLHASTWKSCAWIKHDGLCSMWAVGHLPLVQCSYWIRSIIKETYNTRFALLIMQAIFCKVLNHEHLNSPFHFFSLNCELQFLSIHENFLIYKTIKKKYIAINGLWEDEHLTFRSCLPLSRDHSALHIPQWLAWKQPMNILPYPMHSEGIKEKSKHATALSPRAPPVMHDACAYIILWLIHQLIIIY